MAWRKEMGTDNITPLERVRILDFCTRLNDTIRKDKAGLKRQKVS